MNAGEEVAALGTVAPLPRMLKAVLGTCVFSIFIYLLTASLLPTSTFFPKTYPLTPVFSISYSAEDQGKDGLAGIVFHCPYSCPYMGHTHVWYGKKSHALPTLSI